MKMRVTYSIDFEVEAESEEEAGELAEVKLDEAFDSLLRPSEVLERDIEIVIESEEEEE